MPVHPSVSSHPRVHDPNRVFRIIRMRGTKILKISVYSCMVSSGKLGVSGRITHLELRRVFKKKKKRSISVHLLALMCKTPNLRELVRGVC